MSKFSDQERTIAAAINAANEVLREAGINETQVVELVVANCNELKDLGAENASKSFGVALVGIVFQMTGPVAFVWGQRVLRHEFFQGRSLRYYSLINY